jgi:hypothetical protein
MTASVTFHKNELIIPLYFVITNHLEFIKFNSKKHQGYRIFRSSVELLPKYIKQLFSNIITYIHEFEIILPNQDISVVLDKNKLVVGLFDENFENFTEMQEVNCKQNRIYIALTFTNNIHFI